MMKKRWSCLLTVAILLLSMLLSACTGGQNSPEITTDGEDETEALKKEYSVTVADYFGGGMKDVVVKILKDGETVVMKVTKADGTVYFDLADGSYDVALDFPSEGIRAEYTYDSEGLTLTPDAPALTVTLYNAYSETVSVQGYSHVRNATVPTQAYKLKVGAYVLKNLDTADRTYFLFRPERTGIYRFAVISDARFEFGYYGGNINGSKDSLLPVENKTIEVEIRSSNIGDSEETTTPYLIGVMPKSESVTDCILVIERVSDVEFSPLDTEWKTILPQKDDLKRINYLNWSFSDFTSVDVTSSEVTVIFNENDGFYHYGTEDGPIVYLRLNTASGYLGENGTIYEAAELSQFGAYIYDDDGKFLYKETYNQLIFDYAAICDPTNGACPLTKQLVYVMETIGDARGWFDSASGNYLFGNVAANKDMLPYFACGYYQTVTPNTSGSEANPTRLHGETNGSILVKAGTPLHLQTSAANLTFEINATGGELRVTCNGKTYVTSNGALTLTVSAANAAVTVEVLSGDADVSAIIRELT